MARKRKTLRKMDYQSPEYWEKLLREEGLSMEAGTSRRVTYVGDSSTLEWVAGQQEMGTRDNSGDKDVTHTPK
jgi:hypothetical protein